MTGRDCRVVPEISADIQEDSTLRQQSGKQADLRNLPSSHKGVPLDKIGKVKFDLISSD